MPGPHSESPFKLDGELGLAHPPQYPQKIPSSLLLPPLLLHGHTEGTLECSSHRRVKGIYFNSKFRLLIQMLIAKYYKWNYLFKEFNIYSCKWGQTWEQFLIQKCLCKSKQKCLLGKEHWWTLCTSVPSASLNKGFCTHGIQLALT